jgi:hypothetical protein
VTVCRLPSLEVCKFPLGAVAGTLKMGCTLAISSPDIFLRLGNDKPIPGLAAVSGWVGGLLCVVSALSHKV